MKKYLSLLLLIPILAAACNTPGEASSDDILPTVVPTIVVPEVVNQEEPVETNEQTNTDTNNGADSSEAIAADAVAAADEAATDETAVSQDTGQSVINLDDFLIYDEPQEGDYRSTLEFYMTVTNSDGAEETVGYAFAEGSRTRTPDASTMTFNMEGAAAGGLGDTMTVTQIEDAFYYSMPPNECIALAGGTSFDNPFALLLDAGGFLTEDAQRVLPDETINGVPSYHYALNQDNLQSWEVYEIYEADLYVAKEGGYVVRLLITGFGVNDVVGGNMTQEGDIYYELNFIPTDNLPAIGVPIGCEQASAVTTDYPVMADAMTVQSAPGLYSYETQASFNEVIDFYKDELTQNNEWAVAQELIQEPNGTVTFTGAGGTLMVNLGPGPTGGVLVGILEIP